MVTIFTAIFWLNLMNTPAVCPAVAPARPNRDCENCLNLCEIPRIPKWLPAKIYLDVAGIAGHNEGPGGPGGPA